MPGRRNGRHGSSHPERSLGERRVTHRDCVRTAISLISQIRKSFSLESDGFEDLIGHSRGAYVAIGVLGQAHISGGAC